ncbi:MAG TPA: MBL fold metallo-hydrolase [Kiritimatiellia bacterium]|nr:MBL fold metallo-hydrolase [Kiritimatiellia bacterium]
MGQKVSITILADNLAAEGLASEHGFAAWIETDGAKILFDTGNGDAMMQNAETLGIALPHADMIVLSHGHNDHTGNLATILQQAPQARLYLHPEALRQRYSIRESAKPIGMPASAVNAVSGLAEHRRMWVTATVQISGKVRLTGPVPRRTAYEDTGGPFFKDAAGAHPDDIPDDMSLWIETSAGLVVCLGCCHSGVINTLTHITAVSGERRIRCVVGGTHLVHASAERMKQTSAALKAYNIPRVIPCHCTGGDAAFFLKEELGETVHQGYAGMRIDI